MRKSLLFLLPVFVFQWSACSGGGNSGTLNSACVSLLACTEAFESLSQCFETADTMDDLDLSKMTYLMNTIGNERLSLLLYADCLSNAGTDCDAVLRCLNGGEDPPDPCQEVNTYGGRSCDGDVLVGCHRIGLKDTDGYRRLVQTRIDCSELDLACVTVSMDDEGGEMAICGQGQAASTTDGLEVACDGNLAQVQMRDANLQFDCGFYDATCESGSYSLYEGVAFCVGKGADCTVGDYQDSCDGNKLLMCIGGKVGSIDCGKMGGQSCVDGACSYNGCSPTDHRDNCSSGVVTFCSKDGEIDLSCTDYGFSGCEGYSNLGARCY